MLKKILFLLGNALLWGGAWQLDLLAAPAFWDWQNYSARYPTSVYYLPFNIPLDKTIAYCMFWIWIFVGAYLMAIPIFLLPEYEKTRIKTMVKKLFRRSYTKQLTEY